MPEDDTSPVDGDEAGKIGTGGDHRDRRHAPVEIVELAHFRHRRVSERHHMVGVQQKAALEPFGGALQTARA